MYIKCRSCHSKIVIQASGDYICSQCGGSEQAKIEEFYSNVYPTVFNTWAVYVCILLLVALFMVGKIGEGASLLLMSLSVFTILAGIETFHLVIARTRLGVFYKSQNPVAVYFYGSLMSLLSIVLLVSI